MPRYIYLLVFMFCGFSATAQDSTDHSRVHILLSSKPVVRWLSGSDSIDNFFYSKVQFELQYQYKRNVLGFGFDNKKKTSMNYVNGLPNDIIHRQLSLAPFYSFMVYDQKRWKCFAGAGYIKNLDETTDMVTSKIEVTTKTHLIIEEGGNLFFRFNYSFSKRLSLETEIAFYATRVRREINENYPLTPSMNSYKTFYSEYRTYAVPSNVFLKYYIF